MIRTKPPVAFSHVRYVRAVFSFALRNARSEAGLWSSALRKHDSSRRLKSLET